MPSYPHAIRLRGPWAYEPLSSVSLDGAPAPLPPPGRATLPTDWGSSLGAEFHGRVRYRRGFNRPSGLDPHERVWLVVEGADAGASVAMNGRELGEVRGYALSGEFDVTEWIEPRNELNLEVELPPAVLGRLAPLRTGREHKPGGPIGEVRLEVRSTLFISELAVWSELEQGFGRLHVAGRIGGEAAASSHAVIVGGFERELLYGEFRSGEPFELTEVVRELPCWPPNSDEPATVPLEIKLVSGGSAAWRTVRRTAWRPIAWQPAEWRLAVCDMPLPWPLAVLDPPEREFDERQVRELLAAIALPPGAAVALREILPDAWYDHFDAAGRPVVQSVPLAWAGEVCRRLAHHPSIVAWTAPDVEIAEASHDQLIRSAFGRPWVASESALR